MKSIQSSHQAVQWHSLLKLLGVVIFVVLAIALYMQWGSLVVSIIEWQKTLHSMLAEHMSAVSEDVLKYGGALMGLSFIYGVFHAVGPGHGKAVIVTYLGTNKESIPKAVFISMAAAMLQSLVAIALVTILARFLAFQLSDVHNYGNDITFVSYALVMLLGALLAVSSLARIYKQIKVSKAGVHSQAHSHHNHDHDHAHDHDHDHIHDHIHHNHSHHDHSGHGHSHHSHGCGCSHAVTAEPDQSTWQTMTVILSMGMRPCSGAIVVLIYAHLVGVYSYGVLATLLMGLGTGLSVSLIALATLYARSWFEKLVSHKSDMNGHTSFSFHNYLRFIGGAILVALGWSFINASLSLASGHPLF